MRSFIITENIGGYKIHACLTPLTWLNHSDSRSQRTTLLLTVLSKEGKTDSFSIICQTLSTNLKKLCTVFVVYPLSVVFCVALFLQNDYVLYCSLLLISFVLTLFSVAELFVPFPQIKQSCYIFM